jgi:hypothetical protein
MDKSIRRWIMAAVAVASLAGSTACKKDEAAPDVVLPPVSVLAMAQPRAERQLVAGFWAVENNSWRWTKHNFVVLLAPPPGAAQKGANLELRFSMPDSVISRRQSVTLSATAGSVNLVPATYTAAGAYLYKADVPADAFKTGGPVMVAFSTDRYLRSGEVEQRELALIANSIGLTAK